MTGAIVPYGLRFDLSVALADMNSAMEILDSSTAGNLFPHS